MPIAMVGVAWYKREDYAALKKLFTDGDTLPETFDDWLCVAERLSSELRAQGQAFQKVYINPNTFPAWCMARGLDFNAQARIRFASETAAGLR